MIFTSFTNTFLSRRLLALAINKSDTAFQISNDRSCNLLVAQPVITTLLHYTDGTTVNMSRKINDNVIKSSRSNGNVKKEASRNNRVSQITGKRPLRSFVQ